MDVTLQQVQRSVWWGWGDPANAAPLPAHARRMLDERLGARSSTTNHPPVQLDSIEVPDSRVGDRLRSALVDAVGAEHLLDSAADRILRAGGKSYPDLVRARTGHLPYVPDAVALPSTHREVADVVAACVAHDAGYGACLFHVHAPLCGAACEYVRQRPAVRGAANVAVPRAQR